MREWSPRWQTAIILALLAAAAIIPYWQVRHFEFITFDDRFYVWDNPVVRAGLTWKGVQWAFTALYMSNWHPLTWLSHMLDCEMFWRGAGSQWPGGHHLVNVFFHAANTMLLFWLFRIMTGAMWRSALVAALFALHPLHVESVAWVAERKDVLSTFFGLLAMLAYVRYTKRPGLGRYAIVAALFACSLLSKPMLVTLPFVLLLLDYWPLNRVTLADARLWRVALEKVPLLVMSAASSVITVIAQRSAGSIYSLDALPMDQRLANAAVSYVQYLEKTFWPSKLAVIYPLPEQYPAWQVATSILILILITAAVVMFGRRRKHLVTGWLWYLGTLVPVIGLVQVGMQAMADRYTYVPLIGIFVMIAWSIPDLRAGHRQAHSALVAALSIVLAVLGWAAHVQASYWRDSTTIFNRTLAITGDNLVAHMHLGYALQAQGRWQEAVQHYEKAAGMRVKSRAMYFNYANALVELGRVEDAIPHYELSLRLGAEDARVHHNLGVALFRSNRPAESLPHFRKAIELQSDYPDAFFNMGLVYIALRQPAEAIAAYRSALQLEPDMVEAHKQLGVALAIEGQLDQAIASFERALQLDPDDAQTNVMLQQARDQLTQSQVR